MHVGKRIKDVLDEQGRSASWLASKIPCERTNMYDIFKRKDVSARLYQHLDNTAYHNLNIIPTFFKGSHYKVVA